MVMRRKQNDPSETETANNARVPERVPETHTADSLSASGKTQERDNTSRASVQRLAKALIETSSN
jgi:hypothetical protein